MCHNEYGIPFIITQDMKTMVENTQMVFKKNDIVIENDNAEYREQLLNNFRGMINSNFSLDIKMSNKYTGREVAILTDSHALYEPTLAVLENIRRLTHTKFLTEYKKFLKPGAEIWFKTDDTDLFNDSQEYFKECGFELEFVTYDLHNSDFTQNLMTEYETKFTNLGMKTMFLRARLK